MLHSFLGADGFVPASGVFQDADGNLYGTTTQGGGGNGCFGSGCGVVFKLSTAGKETAIYTFTGGADGGLPYAGVVQDAEGNLYSTTRGGDNLNFGCGTV